MTQHPHREPHARPPAAPSPHSGSASLPQQHKFCWAIKRAGKRGRLGAAQPESMPELLQIVTGLRVRANNAICPGIAAQRTPQQRPKPQTRGHGAEPASRRLPERSRAAPRTPIRPTRGCAERQSAAPARHGVPPLPETPSPSGAGQGGRGSPASRPLPTRGRYFADAILLYRAAARPLTFY